MITNENSPLQEQLNDSPLSSPPSYTEVPPFEENNPVVPEWGFLTAIGVFIFSVVALLFVPFVIIIPYFIYLLKKAGTFSPDMIATDKTFLLLSIIGVIPAHLLTLALIWIVVTHRGRFPFWRTIHFTWPAGSRSLRTVFFSIVAAAALLAIGALVTNLFGGEKTALDQLIESSFQARLATAFLAVATGPLIEELVYRGVLYPAFQRVLGVGGAIALVSILFAGVHVLQYKNNIAVIAVISLLSVVLTTARAKTGSVLPGFFIHLVFNGVQSIIIVLQPFLEKADHATPKAAPAVILAIHWLQNFL